MAFPPDPLNADIRRWASEARDAEHELPLPYSIVPGKRSPRFVLNADGEGIRVHMSDQDELVDPQPVEFDLANSQARVGR